MIVLVFLTCLILCIPVLYMINHKYVQKVALLFSLGQLALLAFNGQFDFHLSSVISSFFHQTVESTFVYFVQQIIYIIK